MDELMRAITANGFAEIEGLQATGSLPVRQDIVNEIIAGLVRDARADHQPPADHAESDVNWWKLVSNLEVQLQDGKLILNFELRR